MNVKKIFRIKSKTNDNNVAPPINIEFYSMKDKWKILNNIIIKKLINLSDENKFYGVNVAPDRSFKERQKYHQLRVLMNQRNTELLANGMLDEKWIIKRMCLEKVEVKQSEA